MYFEDDHVWYPASARLQFIENQSFLVMWYRLVDFQIGTACTQDSICGQSGESSSEDSFCLQVQ